MPPDPQRPIIHLPFRTPGEAAPAPPRQDTVLPDEPPEALAGLAAAIASAEPEERRAALRGVCAAHPAMLDAWARLSEAALSSGDIVGAYAFARVAYHRGLDRLRKHGWGGSGHVRWVHPSNRGFLRGLRALLAAAAALGEEDEAVRCRDFLLDLDPDDLLGVAGYPEVPGPGWIAPAIP